MGERVLLRVSSQGQVTLRRETWRALGKPSHLEAWIEKNMLMLRPALAPTPDTMAMLRREGITYDVLVEAWRVLRARRRKQEEAARQEESGPGKE